MLDFRRGSHSIPYYKQHVDYGRLIMMVVSSVLLLSLIVSFGRPRVVPGPSASGTTGNTAASASESKTLLVGIAIVVGSLCVVACAMLVLYRMVRPGRVKFSVHDVGGSPPDFSILDAPGTTSPARSFAEVMVDQPAGDRPAPETGDTAAVVRENGVDAP